LAQKTWRFTAATHRNLFQRKFLRSKKNLSRFFKSFFSTDGWASILSSGQVQLGFASVSEKMIRQIQHLLLRFGVIANLKKRR
jgi:replicative DNA helicase